MKWHLRACPSCSGDLYVDPMDPASLVCLLCGREYTVVQLVALHGQQAQQAVAP